uniref:ARAD1C24178p n=1 Tax=Blastobotrys adeninivorans TaxID=409370 RepID=A0A060T1E9_BLAAD
MPDFPVPAAYKKKSGSIYTTEDERTIVWKETGAAAPGLQFPAGSVANMRASPATSPRSLLQVILTAPPGATEEAKYQFSFATREALENAKQALQNLLQKRSEPKTNGATGATPGPEASEPAGASGAGTGTPTSSAQVPNNNAPAESKGQVDFIDMDTKSLLQNHQLQQKLLRENKELMRLFQEAVILGSLPASDFWSTRTHLLRGYALQSCQQIGPYNVLSTIKPKTGSDNQINVSLTREKIRDIFDQYPIVLQAYNDNVPNLSESEFWGRFFTSRLFRRLRGERVTPNDHADAILDKYLNLQEKVGAKRRAEEELESIPQYRDIQGNEENDSQRLGNRPDITMQADKSSQDYVSLIRSMNHLSQQMIQSTERQKRDVSEDLDKELEFADLEDKTKEDNGIKLVLKNGQYGALAGDNSNITNQNQNANDNDYNKNIAGSIEDMTQQVQAKMDLSMVATDENAEDITKATEQFTSLVRLRGQETIAATKGDQSWAGDLKTLDQIQITHATSIEFLRHFWSHFLSGDPSQVNAISKLVASLRKSLERVDSVVNMGTSPEEQEKIRFSLDPLVKSINVALSKYEQALNSA